MKKVLIFLSVFLSLSPVFADDTAAADPNDFSFEGEHYNRMTKKVRLDIEEFRAHFEGNFDSNGQIAPNFVPIEAKVGGFLIGTLSFVVRAIYDVLRPFLNVFILALFAFWIMMESWHMMGLKGDSDYWGLAVRIVKRTTIIVIWLWILNNDPAKLFMWLVAPVISLGSGLSDLILGGTANLVGADIPNSCAEIHKWIGANDSLLISGRHAADLLCMPTRLAGFFYTYIYAGLGWMAQGIGGRGSVFVMGLVFVILFIYNTWKFALAALGVIVDLFFVLLFLPFTAVRECFADNAKDKTTKYDGVFRPLFDGLLDFVKESNLKNQIQKFINAIIYFTVLSVVSAICITLLAGVNPVIGGDFISILMIGCLVAYLINQVGDIAKDLGGEIDGSFGKKVEDTITGVSKNVAGWGKKAIKALTKEPAGP